MMVRILIEVYSLESDRQILIEIDKNDKSSKQPFNEINDFTNAVNKSLLYASFACFHPLRQIQTAEKQSLASFQK